MSHVLYFKGPKMVYPHNLLCMYGYWTKRNMWSPCSVLSKKKKNKHKTLSCVKESYRHIKFSCQCAIVVLNSVNIQSVQTLHWNVKILPLPLPRPRFSAFYIISLSYKVKGQITGLMVIAISPQYHGCKPQQVEHEELLRKPKYHLQFLNIQDRICIC